MEKIGAHKLAPEALENTFVVKQLCCASKATQWRTSLNARLAGLQAWRRRRWQAANHQA